MIHMRHLCLAAAIVCGAFPAQAAPCLPPDCTAFPADAGFVNVRDYGAKGDGLTDDTAAINAALTASGKDTGPTFWQDKIVYLPNGTYLVSAPIAKRYAGGHFGSGSILIGQSRDSTVIKLKDHAPDYNDPSNPRAIIFTTAKLLDGSATGGGKDYTNKGEGNDAYMNFVENLTVDAGSDNPGAIGVDYLANNDGAIRNVLVRASVGSGATGIALTRKWPGPALLEHVRIEGFDYGIDADNTEYGVTLEHITLEKQRKIALRNNHNALSIHDLTIDDAPLPVSNLAFDGLIVIDGGKFSGKGDAIQNKGFLNLRGVELSGYSSSLGASPLDGVYNADKKLSASKVSWSLPTKDAPATVADAPENWVSVVKYGAKPDTEEDSTKAIQKAFASGASTIYFPHGTYLINANIIIPPTVQRIVGMTSTIHAVKQRDGAFRYDRGFLRAQNTSHPLTIEKLTIDNSWLGDAQIGIEAIGTQPLVLRDVIGAGVVLFERTASGGEVFAEDISGGTISIAGPQGVWIRQLNTEGGGTRITNNGAPLWILGIKTEHDCTVLDNRNGARTEVLGGLIYIPGSTPADPSVPAFKNTDAKLLVSYAEESFDPQSTYAIHLSDTEEETIRNYTAESLPMRKIGRMVPELTTAQ